MGQESYAEYKRRRMAAEERQQLVDDYAATYEREKREAAVSGRQVRKPLSPNQQWVVGWVVCIVLGAIIGLISMAVGHPLGH